ncbi:MAG: hypothetical protein AAFY02_11350 [Pseudomonadota bacterium]
MKTTALLALLLLVAACVVREGSDPQPLIDPEGDAQEEGRLTPAGQWFADA